MYDRSMCYIIILQCMCTHACTLQSTYSYMYTCAYLCILYRVVKSAQLLRVKPSKHITHAISIEGV